MKGIVSIVALCLLAAVPAFAQEDAEDCRDSKILSRMKGCWIEHCESKDYDEGTFQTSKISDETGEAKHETVEGKKTVINYYCPATISPLQIIRNAETALKAAGFKSVYSGAGSGHDKTTTARKGNLWLQVGSSAYAGETTGYEILIVESEEMVQEMVADASAWADEIERSGRVAIYGIEFDTGKATIRAEAEPVLRELATLLGNDESLRLRVEGHTDNVGSAAANQKLSEERANAVVSWLAKNGIDRSRLTPAGAGASKPVADNATDEGRAKNRRVELVKM